MLWQSTRQNVFITCSSFFNINSHHKIINEKQDIKIVRKIVSVKARKNQKIC